MTALPVLALSSCGEELNSRRCANGFVWTATLDGASSSESRGLYLRSAGIGKGRYVVWFAGVDWWWALSIRVYVVMTTSSQHSEPATASKTAIEEYDTEPINGPTISGILSNVRKPPLTHSASSWHKSTIAAYPVHPATKHSSCHKCLHGL